MGLRGPGAKSKISIGNQYYVSSDTQIRPWSAVGLSRSGRVIAFIEFLKVTSGTLAGEAFTLRPFQRKIIESWYATDSRSRRIVRTGLLSVARKNGKSGLCAALALCHLLGPEQERRGQIVVGATDRDQSALIFDELVAFIDDNPQFSAECNIKRHEKTIEHIPTGSKFKALSSDAKKAHGLSPSVVILDELAQWGSGAGRALYDALTTAQGARKEPLVLVIGTQSAEDNSLMSQLVDNAKDVAAGIATDPTFSGFVFEIPADADVFDEANWHLANPALGDFRDLQDMRTMAERAKRMPTLEATFRNLFCNQRISTEASLITRVEWLRCQSAESLIPKEEIYLALDLSAVVDLTALVGCSAKANEDRLKAWFWKPGDEIEEHTKRDRAPYDVWVKQGWIEAPKGRAIDYGYVAKRVAEICSEYQVLGLAFDRWHIKNFMRELGAIGLEYYVADGKEPAKTGALPLVPWGQGYVDMAPAVNAFEISVLEGRLKHDGNPVLTMCVANAIVDMDAAGNRKLDKSASRFRIDGAVATAMAIGLKYRQVKKPQPEFQAFFV